MAEAPQQSKSLTAQTVAALRPRPIVTSPNIQLTGLTASEREFLPSALEILDSPPAPAAVYLQWGICGIVALALLWAYFGWLDVYAVAQGKIQPSGRSKVVQALDAGKVSALRIQNGAHVEAGQVLIELDPTETLADRDTKSKDVESLGAEIARRRLEVTLVNGFDEKDLGRIDFPVRTTDMTKAREVALLRAELIEHISSRASIEGQLAEKAATKAKLKASIQARDELIQLSKERVTMRETLSDRGAGSRALIIEAMQQMQSYVTTNTSEQGQYQEADAAMRSLEKKILELNSRFIADQMQKQSDAERKLDSTTQDLVKAQSRLERTQLRAPISGTVQQLAITTVGQVIASGQPLLIVVPIEGPIEVEALVLNRDIGFVEVGQAATIKVEAFPYTRYGTIDGTVITVSRDGVAQPSTDLSDPSIAAKPQGPPSGDQQANVSNLVFPVTVALKTRTILTDGKNAPLSPGMTVSVDILTGKRRAIDYLLSPIRHAIMSAGHER